MTHPNTFNPQQIAQEAAEAIAIKYINPPDAAQGWVNIRTDLQALILSAAARMVRESGAVEAMESCDSQPDYEGAQEKTYDTKMVDAALASLRCITEIPKQPKV